jgi:hypothetical protein
VTGNNAVAAHSQGNPTGDVNFLFVAFHAYRIVVNTCGFSSAHINTHVRVYNKCPTNGGVVVGNQSALFEPCSVLTYDIHTPGSYWIVVEGYESPIDEGTFELEVSCTDVPTPKPSPVPTHLPTMKPTHAPTPLPSPRPTPLPSALPSPQPSPLPTTADTVGMAVTMTFSASSTEGKSSQVVAPITSQLVFF